MRLIDAVAGERTPVIPLMGYPGVTATGNSVEDVLTRVEPHLESMMFLEDRYHPPCLFHVMDLTVEAEAVGLPIRFEGDGPPSVCEHPVTTYERLVALEVPDPASAARMPLFLEVVSTVSERLSGLAAAYCVGPFTLAAELCGAEDLAMLTVTDPDFASDVVNFAASVSARYAVALASAGAGVVTILEPTAVILSPKSFEKFCVGFLIKVFEEVRASGACPVLHICGDTTHLLRLMAETGADGLSLDAPVDLSAAFDAVSDDVVVIGNVDPVGVMVEGKPEEVRRAARALLERFGERHNYVLSSGCDLPPATPLTNLDALFAAEGI